MGKHEVGTTLDKECQDLAIKPLENSVSELCLICKKPIIPYIILCDECKARKEDYGH